MPNLPIFKLLVVVLAVGASVACTRPMGHVTDVRIQRVAWADVDKRGTSVGCCEKMDWLRVDFLSDMDYAKLARNGIHAAAHYGWCPIDGDHELGGFGLSADLGEVDGSTVMVPAAGTARRPLYAYHGFLPASFPGRRYPPPGQHEGAYDLRDAKGDFCVNVSGGKMWLGRHGESTGGVVSRAALLNALGRSSVVPAEK